MDWHGYVFLAKNRPVHVHKPGDPPLFPGQFLSERLRTQLLHVLFDAVGTGPYAQEAWELVVGHYDREMGTVNLGCGRLDPQSAFQEFLTGTDGIEDLDLTALALIVANEYTGRIHGR